MLIVGSQESWKCSCVDDERPNANRAGPMNMPETKKVSCAEAKSRHIQGSVAQGKKFGKLLNHMEPGYSVVVIDLVESRKPKGGRPDAPAFCMTSASL